jgi:hypothetical protein
VVLMPAAGRVRCLCSDLRDFPAFYPRFPREAKEDSVVRTLEFNYVLEVYAYNLLLTGLPRHRN